MYKSLSSNFSVSFSKDKAAGTAPQVSLETDPDNPELIPGTTVNFYLFKKNCASVELFSTMGNISSLGSVLLPRDEFVTVTAPGPLSIQNEPSGEIDVTVIGSSFNYGGVIFTADGWVVEALDPLLGYVLACLHLVYKTDADHYSLDHAPIFGTDEYPISILAIGSTI